MPASISVIIPACNASAHLTRCLDALSYSRYQPYETILVDDGSKDDTVEIAESFGVTVIRNETRMGPAFARNLAAKQATGDILFFIDSDVCAKAESLDMIREHFDSDPE